MANYNGKKRAADWIGCTVSVVRDIKLPTFSGYEKPKVVKKGSLYIVDGVNPKGGLNLISVGPYKPLDDFYRLGGIGYSSVAEHDYYKAIDSINASVREIDSIIADAKSDDPEFYQDLMNILKPAIVETETKNEPEWLEIPDYLRRDKS